MSDMRDIPLYRPNQGTVKISGMTIPHKAGSCAHFFLRKGFDRVEFFCIGANANQQCMKAMGVFMILVEHDKDFEGKTVAFQPLRFKTETKDDRSPLLVEKDCVVWRTLLVSRPEKI